ncbi:peptidyl-tRNA hydrolase [Candidatus Micrarchaeota archaeon]|nr:peptidyl-tRNA hydrolase [Candidatus Micrarchaeota archaeon]
MSDVKQVIVVRKDLKLTRGKMSAQVAHAAVEAYRLARDVSPQIASVWLKEGAKKVVLYVDDQAELMSLMKKIPPSIPTKLIIDAGLTQLEPGTMTCLGIGPYYEDELDRYTGDLKLVD